MGKEEEERETGKTEMRDRRENEKDNIRVLQQYIQECTKQSEQNVSNECFRDIIRKQCLKLEKTL